MKSRSYWRWRISIGRERVVTWIAFHLPREIAYWCYIRVASSATVHDYPERTPDQVNIMEAMEAWK